MKSNELATCCLILHTLASITQGFTPLPLCFQQAQEQALAYIWEEAEKHAQTKLLTCQLSLHDCHKTEHLQHDIWEQAGIALSSM